MKTTVLLPAIALAALLAAPVAAGQQPVLAHAPDRDGPAPASDIAGAARLVFTAVAPCRLLDTRVPSLRGGPLLAGSEREFLVYDAELAEEQGGTADGCNLPASIRAVVINLTATRTVDRGFVTAWAHGVPRPGTSNLNLVPGEDISNQISVAINTDASEPDLRVYSYGETDLVADIVGYYAEPASLALDCVMVGSGDVTVVSNGTLGFQSPFCPAGYSMLSGSCFADGVGLQLVTAQMTAPPDTRHFCAYQNVSPQPGTARVEGRCCRVPGG